MKKTVTIIGIITLYLLVFGLPGAAVAADKVIKWKVQTHWPASSPSYKGSGMVVAEQVKEATGGRLILELFPSGSLVPSKEIYNSVSRGMFQMGTASPGYFQNRVPLASIATGLPYSFRDMAETIYFHRVMGFEKMMQDACKKDGVFYVTDVIYRTELVMKKPVRTLADFKGLKVRSYGAMAEFFKAAGAAPTYLPGAEIYPALASGVVDAAHWGAAVASEKMGFYEVCKYHLKPALTIAGATCYLTNQKALDKLPEDVRKAFVEVMERHYLERTVDYKALDEIALAEVQKKYGVEVIRISPEEQKKITKVAMGLWEKEGEKSPENGKALEMLKEVLKKFGHL